VECTWHTFGTQVEDQNQAQDKDEVQVLVLVGNHLEERKGLQEEFIVTHQVKSITWINQTKSIQVSVKDGSWREVTSP
jgi:hypothetical protein